MPGLFDGSKLEQPVTCSACGKAMDACACPRNADGEVCLPRDQDARVRREKRRGKWVTVVTGLDPQATDLKQLAKQLKAKCASGGSTTDDGIELQGDHRDSLVTHLKSLGFPAKPAGG
jgi:translation initiation factor 1